VRFEFTAPLWLYRGKGGWHFITLPADIADEIEDLAASGAAKGFGSVPVRVTIGESTWETSLFPSNEKESFVLPVKKPVREREGLVAGDEATVVLEPRDAS